MKTSYFSGYRGEHGVAITVKSPPWFFGKHYPPLAPRWTHLGEYKANKISQQEYAEGYLYTLEARHLTPARVLADLGDEAVLLCYEAPGKFCHRHLVAEWLAKELGPVLEWRRDHGV